MKFGNSFGAEKTYTRVWTVVSFPVEQGFHIDAWILADLERPAIYQILVCCYLTIALLVCLIGAEFDAADDVGTGRYSVVIYDAGELDVNDDTGSNDVA